jgi:hypothetical protein
MKDSILKITDMEMEYLLGQMEESMTVRGKEGKCMVKGVILTQMELKQEGFGLRVKGL